MLPLGNDDTLRVTAALRDVLSSGDSQYVPVDDDVARRAYNKWLHLWGSLPQAVKIDDVQQAATRAQKVGAAYAITGKVQKATRDEVRFDIALIDAAGGKEIYRDSFTSAPPEFPWLIAASV